MAVVLWKYSNPYASAAKLPTRQFTFNGQRLDIAQNLDAEVNAHQNTSEKLWDGSYLLSSFLASAYFPPGYWRGRACVELGCGTGLVGMVAWLHGATVTLTDRESALQRARENVAANVARICGDGAVAMTSTLSSDDIIVKPLDWCHQSHHPTTAAANARYDVILGSEVVYLPEMSEHLLRTMERLASPGTDIFVAYKERGLGEDNFWRMLSDRSITVETMSPRFLPEDFEHSTYKVLKFRLASDVPVASD